MLARIAPCARLVVRLGHHEAQRFRHVDLAQSALVLVPVPNRWGQGALCFLLFQKEAAQDRDHDPMISNGELIVGERERFPAFVLLLKSGALILSFEVARPGIIQAS